MLRVHVSKNKHTENTSTWSWGLSASNGKPVLNSTKAFDSEGEAVDDMKTALSDWNLILDGDWQN